MKNFDLKKYLAEGRLLKEEDGLSVGFENSPNMASYEDVLEIFNYYDDESIVKDFQLKFPQGKDISKTDYFMFAVEYIDDRSEIQDIKRNWISIFSQHIEESKMDNFNLKKYLAKGRLLKEERGYLSQDIDDLIQQGLQADRTIKAQNQNKKSIETPWNELDWDFSDSDSVNFGNFEVDIDQFLQAKKNGYVIDDNGVKRIIDKLTLKYILQSYKENQ